MKGAAVRIRVTRCGADLGVCLPQDLVQGLGIGEGSWVELRAERDRIVIAVAQPLYALDELLAGMTPAAMHQAFDWGEDRGREVAR